ncbi:hypothetical protein K504DRAFT_496998 [Pleomassaria siparia CBS 279.74]|uniref:Life-span regulatory factor-domain-containing protein n=1 Tax=Pleomassaria siparia CBS 279.74 TaxID=1314801 RepID=A0A6G1KRD1_9PLEO|nr:hypothetical protein K504DRAFT_496998 [Pleomassaria siparia CBS 279.74]
MATHHARPSNHSKKPLPTHARPTRPVHLSKRTSSYGAVKGLSKPTHNHQHHHQHHHQHQEDDYSEDEGAMATSFLNYCTTCEKQIIVPNNSVLYCSESCKAKDNEKSLSFQYDHSPPYTPFGNFSFEDLHFRDIVTPRSPTALHSKRSSIAFSDLSADDNVTLSDEKQRLDSDASRYLRQFYSGTAPTETAVRFHRPRFSRASTSNVNFSTAPSLSHTPTSSISFSLPYTPSTRPLGPRTNPHSTSYGAKSIDLVKPLTCASSTTPSSPPHYSLKSAPVSKTSISNIEGEIMYEKSPIPSVSPANGSLGRLLASTPRWT